MKEDVISRVIFENENNEFKTFNIDNLISIFH